MRLLLVLGWMAALGVLAGPGDGDLRPAAVSHDLPLRPFEGGNSDWRIVLKRYGPGEAIFVFEPPGRGDTTTGTLRSVDPDGLIGSMHGEFGLAGTLHVDDRTRSMKVLLAPATREIPCRTRTGTAYPQAILVSVGRSDPHGIDDSRILYGCGRYLRD
ncbi:hypothetical protein [Marilutibacter chinensis]|uniref:hypothetical protein n=1 Tax=Marilutibacter chinensis TaxID=2912247 RepID=UPI001F1B37B8|nr:hypothetical protein [Lysobacter chinensis]